MASGLIATAHDLALSQVVFRPTAVGRAESAGRIWTFWALTGWTRGAGLPLGACDADWHRRALGAAPLNLPVRAGVSGRLRDDPDVGLGLAPLAEDLPGLVVGNRAGDDHILALPPVDRRGRPVLGGQRQGVDHPKPLFEVAAGGHRVDEDQLDLLIRADHEHIPYRLVVRGGARAALARGLGGQHAIQLRNVV